MERRVFLHGAALCPLALFPLPPDPAQTATVVVDFSPESVSDEAGIPGEAGSPGETETKRSPLELWAGFGSDKAGKADAPRRFACDPPGVLAVRAVRNAQTRQVGVCAVSTSDKPASLRLDTRLGGGLWRGEAALLNRDGAAKTWRMESALRTGPGAAVKVLPLGPGQSVALRWTETVQAAQAAVQALQTGTASLGVSTYSGANVPGVLASVDNLLTDVPYLVEKNKRPEIVKKIHRALLLLAQAEAMSQNAKIAPRDVPDAAFDDVTLALSEVSCAAWNLVLRQSIETANGVPVLRVTLTNGGSRTLPVVSLSAMGVTGAKAKNARPVFRSTPPGASVSAQFALLPGDEKTARGAAQWIVDMGAARIYAPLGVVENA